MNSKQTLVPQGKLKKGIEQNKKPPVSKDRRRLIGFMLMLIAAFILLPELQFMPEDVASVSNRSTVPLLDPWPENSTAMSTPSEVTPQQVPEADIEALDATWSKHYSAAVAENLATPAVQKTNETDLRLLPQNIQAGYLVQVASFTQKKNATELMQTLNDAGFRSFIKQKQEFHQVFVGPQLLREDAQSALEVLENKHQLKGIIINYRP